MLNEAKQSDATANRIPMHFPMTKGTPKAGSKNYLDLGVCTMISKNRLFFVFEFK